MIITLAEAKSYLKLQDRPILDITGNGSLATATITNHGLKNGMQFTITGSTSFDGTYYVEKFLDANKFSFACNITATGETGYLNEYDSLLTGLIGGITNLVEEVCGTKYGAQTNFTEILDMPNDGIVKLSYSNIKQINSIKVSQEQDFDDAENYETVEAPEYFLYEKDGKIEFNLEDLVNYIGYRKAISIDYDTDEAPEGLKMAVKMLLEYYYQQYNDKSINLRSRTEQGNSIVYLTEPPKSITMFLHPFKIVRVGGAVLPKNIIGMN